MITHDYRAILTLSTRTEQVSGVADVTISLPRLLGGDGVMAVLTPPLAPDEATALRRSAEIVRPAINELQDARGGRFVDRENGTKDFPGLSRRAEDDIETRRGVT